jgi:hypothetical protein
MTLRLLLLIKEENLILFFISVDLNGSTIYGEILAIDQFSLSFELVWFG